MLVAVLKLGLLTQTFAQATIDIALAIHTNTRQSPTHWYSGSSSNKRMEKLLARVIIVENRTPNKQNKSASNMAPAVLAGLK